MNRLFLLLLERKRHRSILAQKRHFYDEKIMQLVKINSLINVTRYELFHVSEFIYDEYRVRGWDTLYKFFIS